MILFVSFILMAALSPFVGFLIKNGVPKILSIILVFIGTLLAFSLIVFSIAPFFTVQVQALLKEFPSYITSISNFFKLNLDVSQLNSIVNSGVSTVGKSAFDITTKVLDAIFSVVMIFVIAFYLLIYERKIRQNISSKSKQNKQLILFSNIQSKLGSWARGQIILSFFVGALTWISLTILGLNFALPLAVLAGILEIIPTLGPIIAAVLAVIVALNVSLDMVIKVAVVFTIIQVIENNVLVPKIMEKAVGLNPLVVILAVIIGGKLMGVLGALLSIPFVSLLFVIYKSIKET